MPASIRGARSMLRSFNIRTFRPKTVRRVATCSGLMLCEHEPSRQKAMSADSRPGVSATGFKLLLTEDAILNKKFVPIVAAMAFTSVMPALAAQDWHQVNTFELKGPGAWDYLSADPANHRVFIARTTHTMVVNGQTGALIADIPGQQSAHGVALVPAVGRGFISDGAGEGSIVIFDLATYAILGRLH